MVDALRFELERTRATRRVREPLPTFGGQGLHPGVDLGDNSALLDLMEGR
jgi:hypothetical protein